MSGQEIAGDLILTSGMVQIESTVGGVLFFARSEGTAASFFNFIQWTSTSNGTAPTFSMRRARGTAASPSALAASDYLGDINFRGHDGTAFFDAADIRVIAGASTWTSTEHTCRMQFFVTHTNGTKTEAMRLGHDLIRLGSGSQEMGVNYVTTGGVKWGTATTQKQAWWNATPAVQPTAVTDASGGSTIDAEARTAINALLSRLRTVGLIAT